MLSMIIKRNIVLWRAGTVLFTLLLTAPAFAVDSGMQLDGAGFSNACTRADESWVSFCNGYIQAVIDSIREADSVCLPNSKTRTDIVTTVEKEITGASQLRAMNAYDAVRTVLRSIYPCE
jgi:hypothetical protein